MAAASSSPSFREIMQSIGKRMFAPVYVLYGEEGYFIDRLVEAFENAVPEGERDFNLYQLYAQEIQPEVVISTCRRFPMMSDRQIVILKEAQAVRADAMNKIIPYFANPNPSTVLVVCFRSDKPKGRDINAKLRAGGGVMFESKKLKDFQIDPFISSIAKERNLNIEPKAVSMLRDFIGADIAKIYNEIEKLAMILGPGSMITPESIEKNVGISKDFNNFELVDALAARDAAKAFRIVDYFRRDPKNHPAIMSVSAIFSFFSNMMVAQFSRDKSPAAIKAATGLKWDSQLAKLSMGMRNYNAYRSIEILSAIRDFDVKSKGIGSRQNEYDLLYDLVFKILTCQGRIEL